MANPNPAVPPNAAAAATTAVEAEAHHLLDQLAAEMAHARPAPAPGVQAGDVLNLTLDVGGGDQVALPQTATVDNAGYVWLYDTKTGEPSRCPANPSLLKQQIRKLRGKQEGGGRMLTTIPPEKWPHPPTIFRGELKCRLHADDPERPLWDRMRLPTCNKANLTSETEVESHMASKHKREWRTIQNELARREKAEEKAWRERLLGMQGVGPAVLAAEAVRTPAAAPEADARTRRTRRPAGDDGPPAAA